MTTIWSGHLDLLHGMFWKLAPPNAGTNPWAETTPNAGTNGISITAAGSYPGLDTLGVKRWSLVLAASAWLSLMGLGTSQFLDLMFWKWYDGAVVWFGSYAGGFGDYVLEVGLTGGRALKNIII